MRLQNTSDYTTLTWVKPELDETLRQERNALQIYVEEGEDVSEVEKQRLHSVKVHAPGVAVARRGRQHVHHAEGAVRLHRDDRRGEPLAADRGDVPERSGGQL